MASMIDGVISRFYSTKKGRTIGVERQELILCKHCKWCIFDDLYIDCNGTDKLLEKNVYFCKRFGGKYYETKPDGFCYLAEKGE